MKFRIAMKQILSILLFIAGKMKSNFIFRAVEVKRPIKK